MLAEISAYIYSGLMLIVVLFQAALAMGIPWGAASMGGKYPGKYPKRMRYVALIIILVLSSMAVIVLIRADILLQSLFTISKYAIWLVVVFSAVSVVLNTFTKSKIERIWIPVTGIQLVTSLIVAIS